MLLRFADGQRELLQALRQAVTAGDAQMAARHAHAITGAAGNLGADELRAAARALEQAGRDDRADLTGLLADVEARAAVVFKSIETLRPPVTREAPRTTGAFDPAPAGAALDRLTAALDDCDTTSVSRALNDVDGLGLPAWAADDLERLHRHVDGYEYGEARGIASRLLSRVQNQAS